MRYTQALADRAAAYLALPLTDKRQPAGLLALAEVWAAIQGLPPVACRQCQYSERTADVAAYVREFFRLQNSTTMSDTPAISKYQLAPAYANQTFNHEDYNGTLSADNLTDEGIEFFIGKGYGHAFTERDAAAPSTEGVGSTASAAKADTTDHAAELATEQKHHATTTGKLHKEQEAHGKTSDALKAEKEAHKATKKELSEMQKQLTEAHKQLADLASKAADAADDAK